MSHVPGFWMPYHVCPVHMTKFFFVLLNNIPFHSDWNPDLIGLSSKEHLADLLLQMTDSVEPISGHPEYWRHLVTYTHHVELPIKASPSAPLIRVTYKAPLPHRCHQCNRLNSPWAPALSPPLQLRASIPATSYFLPITAFSLWRLQCVYQPDIMLWYFSNKYNFILHTHRFSVWKCGSC